jgi:hypothetical protein
MSAIGHRRNWPAHACPTLSWRSRHELGGSTDLAQWTPTMDIHVWNAAVIIDIGLELDRTLPPNGHVPPVSVDGLLRH